MTPLEDGESTTRFEAARLRALPASDVGRYKFYAGVLVGFLVGAVVTLAAITVAAYIASTLIAP